MSFEMSNCHRRALHFCYALCLLFTFFGAGMAQGQTTAKNRRDERNENERVEKARKEFNQSESEVKKLQTELQQKSKAYTAAKGAFLRAKEKSEDALEGAEERVGASLGIPEQLKAFRNASLQFQEKSKKVLGKLKQDSKYSEIETRIKASEETLANGVNAETGFSMTNAEIDELEAAIAADKKELQSIEGAAIAADSEASQAKQALDRTHHKLQELRSKLNGKQVANDPKYKSAKTESDKALKKMQESLTALKKAEDNLKKKVAERGTDYQTYLKAKQADAADRNQDKRKKGK